MIKLINSKAMYFMWGSIYGSTVVGVGIVVAELIG